MNIVFPYNLKQDNIWVLNGYKKMVYWKTYFLEIVVKPTPGVAGIERRRRKSNSISIRPS